MEPFVLHHFPVVLEQRHAHFEVVSVVDVPRHNGVVVAVEKDLAKELDGLTFCHVGVGLDEGVVVFLEEEGEVCFEEVGDEGSVSGQDFLDEIEWSL